MVQRAETPAARRPPPAVRAHLLVVEGRHVLGLHLLAVRLQGGRATGGSGSAGAPHAQAFCAAHFWRPAQPLRPGLPKAAVQRRRRRSLSCSWRSCSGRIAGGQALLRHAGLGADFIQGRPYCCCASDGQAIRPDQDHIGPRPPAHHALQVALVELQGTGGGDWVGTKSARGRRGGAGAGFAGRTWCSSEGLTSSRRPVSSSAIAASVLTASKSWEGGRLLLVPAGR